MTVITRNQNKNLRSYSLQDVKPKKFNTNLNIIIPENNSRCRSHRNIESVNYTGMDSIEPIDEFDTNTDIWADITIEDDPSSVDLNLNI
jgi:hypothetical protein